MTVNVDYGDYAEAPIDIVEVVEAGDDPVDSESEGEEGT